MHACLKDKGFNELWTDRKAHGGGDVQKGSLWTMKTEARRKATANGNQTFQWAAEYFDKKRSEIQSVLGFTKQGMKASQSVS